MTVPFFRNLTTPNAIQQGVSGRISGGCLAAADGEPDQAEAEKSERAGLGDLGDADVIESDRVVDRTEAELSSRRVKGKSSGGKGAEIRTEIVNRQRVVPSGAARRRPSETRAIPNCVIDNISECVQLAGGISSKALRPPRCRYSGIAKPGGVAAWRGLAWFVGGVLPYR